ncbi:putative ribonuclease H-like domain-containing protein [Tanacetum coccineum]
MLTLSTFLLKNGYRRGTIDKTLFLKKDKHDIILVQVYVDDIIFGSTKKSWCDEFEALMKSRFQMSSMGELTFFLGLQVKQKPDGYINSQDKYCLLKSLRSLTLSMIGSLMYVTASRPDIMFAVCACSRFQVTPKTSHLSAVKRIFRYLKGKPKLGLWYPRVSSFDLESYSDSDYAGANLDWKSTTGEVMLVNALRRFRESLRRVTDGAEAFLILTLFILCLDKVSTDHAKLVPLGKVCTAKETLEKNTAKGTKCKLEPLISLTDDLSLLSNMAALESCPKHNMIAYLEKTEGNVEFQYLGRSFSSNGYILLGNVDDMTLKMSYDLCISLCQREENAQSEGEDKEMVDEDKEFDEDRLLTGRCYEKVEGMRDQSKSKLLLKPLKHPNQHTHSRIFGDDVKLIATLLSQHGQAKLLLERKEKGARIEADRILAEKLQEKEREQFTIEERAKFLHDTIAAQRKFLAQQRSEPTKNQLRNQMMTYLRMWELQQSERFLQRRRDEHESKVATSGRGIKDEKDTQEEKGCTRDKDELQEQRRFKQNFSRLPI